LQSLLKSLVETYHYFAHTVERNLLLCNIKTISVFNISKPASVMAGIARKKQGRTDTFPMREI
jgi:hypothetical protein